MILRPLRRFAGAVAGLLAIVGTAAVAQPTTVALQDGVDGYQGTQDAYMYSFFPNGRYGASTQIRVRPVPQKVRLDALVRFAIFDSEGGSVPDGATIESATLELYKTSYYSYPYRIHPVLADWAESQVSWNSSDSDTPWAAPGASALGTDIAAPLDPDVVVPLTAQWVQLDVTSSVRAFAAGQANYGWKLDQGFGNLQRYHSSDAKGDDAALRPRLLIRYTTDGGGGSNTAPSVAMSAPAVGATVPFGNAVELRATARDSDGSVAGVTFFANGSLVGNSTGDGSGAWTLAWTPTSVGTYQLSARATDDDGDSTTSATRRIVVEAPTLRFNLSLYTAGKGAGTVAAPTLGLSCERACEAEVDEGTAVALRATPAEGSVFIGWTGADACGANVIVNAATLCTGNFERIDGGGASTTITLQQGSGGYDGTQDAYLYAFHNNGRFGNSKQLRMKLKPTTVKIDMLVRFAVFANEGGPVPNGATIESATLDLYKITSYDHVYRLAPVASDWSQAEVSWNNRLNETPWRVPGVGSDDLEAAIDEPLNSPRASGWMALDATQSVRSMSAGQPNYGWKLTSLGGNGNLQRFHSSEASDDPSLRPRLTVRFSVGDGGGGGNQSPSVTMTSPSNGTAVANGANVNLAASASDPDGTIDRVEFRVDGDLVSVSESAPHTATWQASTGGEHLLRARAFDNDGASADATPVRISVAFPNGQPTVTLTEPGPGSVFDDGEAITVRATASDTDGSIARVAFFANGGAIGTDTSAPYSVQWTGAELGSHTLTAVATDNDNATRTSAAVTIRVREPTGGGGDDSGLDIRPQNLSCLAPERPVQASGVAFEEAFPLLRLRSSNWGDTSAFEQPPGDSSRWFAGERRGRIVSIANSSTTSSFDTVLDITDRVLFNANLGMNGMTFHPDFPTDPRLFVFYMASNPGYPDSTRNRFEARISSFETTDDGETLDADSEEIVLRIGMNSTAHPGGDLHFGNDGYLYIGVGDDVTPGVGGQLPNTLKGKMLRIDVDTASGYGIPADNPYANGGGAPEVYALGFRHPWRWSIDSATGDIWVGDVGNKKWEEVNRVVNGGNYGWPYREGFECHLSFNPNNCDPTGLSNPFYAYSHDEGSAAIAGGYVYRGSALPELYGKYLFGDIVQGKTWALSLDGPGQAEAELLVGGRAFRDFAVDNDGELYGISGRSFWKLVPSFDNTGASAFPQKLSQTGCMDTTDVTQPGSGLVPYDLNVPFWSNGATKERHLAIPDGTTIGLNAEGDFQFPVGAVTVKSFRVNGKLVETRLFVRHDDGGWAGYSYEWDDALSDATLVPVEGKVKTIAGQRYEYPSRSQCLQCHTEAAGFSLGLEALQLNREIEYPRTGRTANQLVTYDMIGLMTDGIGGTPATIAALPPITDSRFSIHDRARAYLHTNCSSCHRANGTSGGAPKLNYQLTDSDLNVCNVVPNLGDFGVPGSRLLKPGEPDASVLALRIHELGELAMPPVAKTAVDPIGTALIDAWIAGILGCP